MGESISAFMKRRAREVAALGREAEAAAREAYGQAIRAEQNLRLSSPGEVLRHGARLVQEGADRAAARVSSAAQEARREAEEAVRRLGRNPVARSAAVKLAGRAGNVAGVARGGYHAAQGLVEGATFAGRLLDPFDSLISPQGESAQDQLRRGVLNAGRSAANYVATGVADPMSVVEDVNAMGQQWRRELDPSATPQAPTFQGELRRNFDIGQNQGELAFDVGSMAVGGPAAKAVRGLADVSRLGKAERFLAQGFSPRAAEHLAKPYPSRGMGHHFVPRSKKDIPKSYGDSVFNVLKPEGISRGDFYELHYKVDPSFHGAGVRGEAWSGKRLGLKKYGLAGQLWYGSPAPLKARVAGGAASAGTLMHLPENEEASR